MEVLTGKGAGSDEVLRQIFEVTNKAARPRRACAAVRPTVPLAGSSPTCESAGTPFSVTRLAASSAAYGRRGAVREFVQCDLIVGTELAVADAETAQVITRRFGGGGASLHDRSQQPEYLDGLIQSLDLKDELILNPR